MGGPPGSTPPVPGAPRGEIVALKGLDLEVHEGEFFGLLGPNGAGKTTTIGILTTRVTPTSGTALVGGADVANQRRARCASASASCRSGRIPTAASTSSRICLSTPRTSASPRRSRRRARTQLLEQLGIADKAHAKVDEMSGGQQQRLMIARALIHEPQVIFLDEPTVGLDPQTRLALWEILRELHAEGRTIVMTTHYMEEADKLCDRIAIVDRGELLELDTPAALKQRAPGGTLDRAHARPATRRASSTRRARRRRARASKRRARLLRVYSDRGGA